MTAEGRSGPGSELGRVARALARAERMETVLRRMADTAMVLGAADGAYVERLDPSSDDLVVASTAGWGCPPPGIRVPFPGSLAQAVLEKDEPQYVEDMVAASERPVSRFLPEASKGLVLPLVSEADALGALVLLRRADADPFDPAEAGQLRTLADLGALALRRQIDAEDAETRRELLEETQDELETARRRLAGVLDALPVGVFVADASGKILEVNEAARDIWEGEAPLLGSPAEYGRYRAYHPGTDVPLQSEEWGLARALAQGETVLEQEVEIETRDGRRRTLFNYAVPVRDDRGEIIAGVAVNVDISEQRRAQEAARFLSEASRVLTSSLEHADTLRRVARLAVPRVADWCAIFIAGEGEGLELVELAHADADRAAFGRELLRQYPPGPGSPAGAHQAFTTGEPQFLPETDDAFFRSVARDEEHLRLLREAKISSLAAVPLIARSRRIGAITMATEGPVRRLTEEDLRLIRDLAERVAVAVDNARLFQETDRRAEEERALRRAAHAVTASYSVDEVIREIAANAVAATAADGAYVEQVDAEAADVVVTATAGDVVPERGSRVAFDISLSRSVIRTQRPRVIARLDEVEQGRLPGDLVERCADCTAVLLPLIDGGEVVGSLTLLRRGDRPSFTADELARARTFADLAALAFRKIHLLEDSERRREELENVMESREGLIRGLTHDLRTPLGAADGMAALLEEGVLGELPSRAREGVVRLRRALGRATGLMDDLLDSARATTGGIATSLTAVDLRDVTTEMFGEYRVQGEARGHRMHLSVPPELPAIRSDAGRVRQILGNLISNAVKYTPEGGRIEVRVRERRRGIEPWLTVAVEDSGPGIPADRHDEVFREFTRLTPESAEGSGLGLAISRRLAEALGGDLTLDSEPKRGSTFTLWLPGEVLDRPDDGG
jgi:signal transduction histidine kinase/PAS domain-containing protein